MPGQHGNHAPNDPSASTALTGPAEELVDHILLGERLFGTTIDELQDGGAAANHLFWHWEPVFIQMRDDETIFAAIPREVLQTLTVTCVDDAWFFAEIPFAASAQQAERWQR